MSFISGNPTPASPQPADTSNPRGPFSIPVPFLRRQIGGGDVVAGMTNALGIQPCTPCEARRRKMNALFQLVPRRGGGQ